MSRVRRHEHEEAVGCLSRDKSESIGRDNKWISKVRELCSGKVKQPY
jgi:hypothetical protein